MRKKQSWLFDLFVLLIMLIALFSGTSRQFSKLDTDAAKYQCYALAFWQGNKALDTVPTTQCAFITHPSPGQLTLSQASIVKRMRALALPTGLIHFVAEQSSSKAFQALPHEYPLLALLAFSPPLLVPSGGYQIAFATWMALIAAVIYLLLRLQSRGISWAFALYLTVGAWVTALGRFDLLPTAFTLLALLSAKRGSWSLAFALLALATMLKFYPLVLVLPFFVAQQTHFHGKWYRWQRYIPLGIFIALCSSIMFVSLSLNVEGTLAPLSYFGDRPIQIESFSASLLRILSMIADKPVQYTYSFGSRNVAGQLAPLVSLGGTLLLILGLASLCWLQWRRDLELSIAVLLTLLVIMLTGKVFSAQYLIWVAPLVAYTGKWCWQWLIGWNSICLLTTIIYPFLYNRGDFFFGQLLPDLYSTILLRNFLLCGFLCLLFYQATNKRTKVKCT